jgi:hypothetical protein
MMGARSSRRPRPVGNSRSCDGRGTPAPWRLARCVPSCRRSRASTPCTACRSGRPSRGGIGTRCLAGRHTSLAGCHRCNAAASTWTSPYLDRTEPSRTGAHRSTSSHRESPAPSPDHSQIPIFATDSLASQPLPAAAPHARTGTRRRQQGYREDQMPCWRSHLVTTHSALSSME